MSHTILVVEDDHLNMKLMRSILALGHYQILEAGEAETGLELAAQHHPDLILMDIQLPGLDGLSATRRLKQTPALANIPVIALTGLAMDGDRENALAAGCDDYISKPINTRTFLASIRERMAPVEEAPAPSVVEPPATATGPGQSKILVVDDDPMNVKLISAILSKDDYAIVTAYGGGRSPPDHACGKPRPDPAGCDDACHGRVPGHPGSQRRSRHGRYPHYHGHGPQRHRRQGAGPGKRSRRIPDQAGQPGRTAGTRQIHAAPQTIP